MTTESQQQIAREARDSIRQYFDKPFYLPKPQDEEDKVFLIILSAIERATLCQRCQTLPCQCGTIRDPQRSKQQEWTPETVREIWDANAHDPKGTIKKFFTDVSVKANAALAAERQRREQSEQSSRTFEKGFSAAQDVIIEQGKQLLSALAAIEKMRKAIHYVQPIIPRQYPIAQAELVLALASSADPSLLHQHDAEVRKPLVEALADLFAMIEQGFLVRDTSRDASPDYFQQAWRFTQRLKKCHDALAKVKE